jgi:hypothetical protein
MLADGTAVRRPLGAHMTVAAMSSGATSGKKVRCSTSDSHDGEPSLRLFT